MRGVLISLALVAFLAVGLFPSTARADKAPHAISKATALLLLDGFRGQTHEPATLGQPASPRRHAIGSATTPDPEETLTQAVERMWSQVRAYRRPGGAEVIVRGHF